MARVLHREPRQALKAASAAAPYQTFKLDTAAEDQIVAAATNTDRPFGISDASVAQGQRVTVYEDGNIVKAVAAASLGHGGEVGVATFGVASAAQGNALATITQLGPVTGASGVSKWAVGVAMENAAAGEVFSVYVSPRQLSNLI